MATDAHTQAASPADRDDLGNLILLSGSDVEEIPWETLHDDPALQHKVLWRSGSVVLGLIKVEPGAVNPSHVHEYAQHHILVTQGEATMVGKRMGPGSYAYIPPGVAHDVVDVGPEGVIFFYTYRPIEVRADERHAHSHPAVSDAQSAVAF